MSKLIYIYIERKVINVEHAVGDLNMLELKYHCNKESNRQRQVEHRLEI